MEDVIPKPRVFSSEARDLARIARILSLDTLKLFKLQ
jgi:hypothetical protein